MSFNPSEEDHCHCHYNTTVINYHTAYSCKPVQWSNGQKAAFIGKLLPKGVSIYRQRLVITCIISLYKDKSGPVTIWQLRTLFLQADK